MSAGWLVRPPGYGSSKLRSAVGSGSTCPVVLSDSGRPRAITANHVRECSGNAGHVRPPPGGAQYRRLVASSQRIFGATMFFRTECELQRAAVVSQARFNFMTEA